jgi:hypothetical protein
VFGRHIKNPKHIPDNVIGVGAAGFVPITFVDGDHFAGVAGDAAVGEEDDASPRCQIVNQVGTVDQGVKQVQAGERDVVAPSLLGRHLGCDVAGQNRAWAWAAAKMAP